MATATIKRDGNVEKHEMFDVYKGSPFLNGKMERFEAVVNRLVIRKDNLLTLDLKDPKGDFRSSTLITAQFRRNRLNDKEFIEARDLRAGDMIDITGEIISPPEHGSPSIIVSEFKILSKVPAKQFPGRPSY